VISAFWRYVALHPGWLQGYKTFVTLLLLSCLIGLRRIKPLTYILRSETGRLSSASPREPLIVF